MRLSLMKAAHVALFGTAYRKYGYLDRLREKSRSAKRDIPQGLKPDVFSIVYGPTKVVP